MSSTFKLPLFRQVIIISVQNFYDMMSKTMKKDVKNKLEIEMVYEDAKRLTNEI